MRIAEVLTAPRSPWQNPFAERVIGTIRHELLDHVIVLNEGHLRRRLHSYLRYYHGSRTHLALEKDAPEPRAVEPPERGRVVVLPQGRWTPPLLHTPCSVVAGDELFPSATRWERNQRWRANLAAGGAADARSCSTPRHPPHRCHRGYPMIGTTDWAFPWVQSLRFEFWPTTAASCGLGPYGLRFRFETGTGAGLRGCPNGTQRASRFIAL